MSDDMIHKNHRKRMFSRYDKTRLSGFDDHEVLEMLLFYVIKGKDTNETAHALLDRFRSLNEVLSAPPEKLVKIDGIGKEAARYLNILGDTFDRNDYVKPPKIFKGKAARDFLTNLFKGKTREELYLICLDPTNGILACKKLNQGSFESTGIDLGKAIRIALDYDSAQVVFAHNHPSGIDVASDADIAVTGSLYSAMNLVGIRMKDHIIVAGSKCVSIMDNYKIRFERNF